MSIAPAPDRTLVVDYTTADDAATSGEDFTAAGSTLTFEPGQPTSQTVAVPVLGDTDGETNETFFLNLTQADGT